MRASDLVPVGYLNDRGDAVLCRMTYMVLRCCRNSGLQILYKLRESQSEGMHLTR